jgi:hypothetical protein
MAPIRKRPHWWDWELEFGEHADERMAERGTDEVALRAMLLNCASLRRSGAPGRFVARAEHRGSGWEIVLEPDYERECVVVVTMYNLER